MLRMRKVELEGHLNSLKVEYRDSHSDPSWRQELEKLMEIHEETLKQVQCVDSSLFRIVDFCFCCS
jgi:hypothetical protein